MIDCHVLPCEAGDGPANIAIDEAMLDAVADGEASAYLRGLFWKSPTLSLGYFQSLAEAQATPRARRCADTCGDYPGAGQSGIITN